MMLICISLLNYTPHLIKLKILPTSGIKNKKWAHSCIRACIRRIEIFCLVVRVHTFKYGRTNIFFNSRCTSIGKLPYKYSKISNYEVFATSICS